MVEKRDAWLDSLPRPGSVLVPEFVAAAIALAASSRAGIARVSGEVVRESASKGRNRLVAPRAR